MELLDSLNNENTSLNAGGKEGGRGGGEREITPLIVEPSIGVWCTNVRIYMCVYGLDH